MNWNILTNPVNAVIMAGIDYFFYRVVLVKAIGMDKTDAAVATVLLAIWLAYELTNHKV